VKEKDAIREKDSKNNNKLFFSHIFCLAPTAYATLLEFVTSVLHILHTFNRLGK
jgi:hypothetical protein